MLTPTGFYRVNYDEQNWKLLTKHLMDPSRMHEIIPTNRAQLLDDSLNLARAGLLNYSIAMNVTQYLYNELDYLPWKSALTAFSYLDDMLIRTAGYDKFKVRRNRGFDLRDFSQRVAFLRCRSTFCGSCKESTTRSGSRTTWKIRS